MNEINQKELNNLQSEAIEMFNNDKNDLKRAYAYGWIHAIDWIIEVMKRNAHK